MVPSPLTPQQPTGEPPARVLVVDDEPAVRRLVARLVAAGGHVVDTAGGTDEALARMAGGNYDIALIDLNMPGRDGLELLDGMAAAGLSVVPVLLTGTRDVVVAVGGMKRGAFDYVSKPVEADALRWTVDRAVGAARARRREAALERVAADWAATFDACPDLLLVLDPAGRVLRANGAAAGRAGADPAGKPVAEVYPAGLGAALAGGVAGQVFDPALDAHFLTSVHPIRSAAGESPPVVAAARDVTALVRGEEERGRLLRRLLTAQEDERGRIARELHDGVGQSVVMLSLGLAALRKDDDPGADDALIRRLGRVAADTLEEIRRLSQGLRPAVLDDLGLVPALRRLGETFSQVHGVRVDLVLPDPEVGRLPTEVESAVYRIAQEALANVAKHARATGVDVVLEATGPAVRLTVADDGVGFPFGGAAGGFGLSAMRERAVVLGGSFRVDSSPARGTVVDAQIPTAEATP